METEDVTLAIPQDILRKAKLIAVERNLSLSGLLSETLAEIVARDDAYERARRRHLAWLDHAADLGTGGQVMWTRSDLHER